MMACGHAANATTVVDGQRVPSCAICAGIDPGATMIAPPPDLTGRISRCTCGKEAPSDSRMLAFFEYRGPGSAVAADRCAVCHYAKVAHQPGHHDRICDTFTAHGPFDTDTHYCGHAGWD